MNPSQKRPLAKILVVDDDAEFVIGTSLRLLHAGYQVDTAKDGIEALEKIASESYGLILMDIRMPRMDGLEALKEITTNPLTSGLPVVIFSASPGDQVLALDSGAKCFLRKPIENTKLLAVTEALVQRQTVPI